MSADCVFPNQILVYSEGGAVWGGKRKKTKTHHLYHSDLLWKTKSSIWRGDFHMHKVQTTTTKVLRSHTKFSFSAFRESAIDSIKN